MDALDQQPTHRRGRWLQAVLAVALVVVSAAGLWASSAGPATADPDGPDREAMHEMMANHEGMHGMMNAMHGEGSAARMHDAQGAEEMMQECSTSMGSMEPGMGSMMGGGARG